MSDLDYLIAFIDQAKFSEDVKVVLKECIRLEIRSDAPLSEYKKIIDQVLETK
jgi:hypothetical protein